MSVFRNALVLIFYCFLNYFDLKGTLAENSSRTIQLGIIVPLSGHLTEYGTAVQNAFKLAELDHPADFKSLSISYEDSQSDPKIALSAFQKLVSSSQDAIFLWGNAPTEAIAPIAESRKVPLIAMSIGPNVARDKKFVIRSVGPSKDLVRPLAHYIQSRKLHQISLIKAEWIYTEELAKALRSELPEEFKIKEHIFAREEKDFRAIITQLGSKNPDVIGVFLGTGQVSSFFRQLNQLNKKIPTFGADFLASSKEIKDSGPSIDGTVFPHFTVCSTFSSKYLARYGDDTHIAEAVNAYDMAIIFAKVATSLPVAEYNQFFSEMRKVKSYNGVCGEINFRENSEIGGYFEYPASLYVVDQGKIVKFKE